MALLPVCLGFLPGCALRYTDAAGRLHTVGLVWQTTVPAVARQGGEAGMPRFTFKLGPLEDSAALLRQRTLGLALSWTDFNRGLALGYAEQLVVLPAKAEGVTFADFDSRVPLETVLTFDARLSSSPPTFSP